MGKSNSDKKIFELRRRAQDFLAKKPDNVKTCAMDIQQLVHELDTYQIELELQNEDLRLSQVELEKSRRRYADLYDFSPVAYLAVNKAGMITEANLTASDMLGVTRDKLINRPFSSLIVPEDQDLFYLHRKEMLKSRQRQSFDLRLKRQDGYFIHALLEAILRSDNGDSPGEFLLAISDITQRKEAEFAKLRRLKERYRAIVMDQNDLICRFDPQGRISFANDAYCRFFGVNQDDILGTNFLPNIHKDDLPLVREHFTHLTPLNPQKTIEHRVILPDGKTYWQQWCGRALFNEKCQVIECQAVGRDITQLKEVEHQLAEEARIRQLFMDALPCVALLLRYETREIVAANKTAISIGAVPGRLCYQTWGKSETPCAWCNAPKLWQSGEAQHEQFWGGEIYWDAYWIPVGEKLYLHYAFDITDQKQIKESLRRNNEELEQRVRQRTLELETSHRQLLHAEKLSAVGKLSASIAHEFNNPLQSIMTIIKGIGKYVPMQEKEGKLIELALQECNRMKNLIANLSDFYRPSTGKPVSVVVHQILDALLLISKKDFHNRNIEVVRNYGDNIPPLIAVADQLKQVFLNLLNNAADACDGNGVITLCTDSSGETIGVHIEDNGKGICSADMDRIFEPFFTTKPGLKGTGLGLPVSYGIIKKHGGRIEVKSELGKGSVFSVYLPMAGGGDNES